MAMTLRLTDEQTAALRATAEREGRSMHEVVVLAISDYVSRRDRRRDELIQEIVAENREALDILANS